MTRNESFVMTRAEDTFVLVPHITVASLNVWVESAYKIFWKSEGLNH